MPGKLRRQRRRVWRFRMWVGGSLSVLLIAGVVGAAHIGALTVSSVQISGNQMVSEERVQGVVSEILGGSYFYVLPKRAVFLLPRDELREHLLASLPEVSSVEISQQSTTVLKVTVHERGAVANWCTDTCTLIDGAGARYGTKDEALRTYNGTPVSDFASLNALVDEVVKVIKSPVSEVRVTDEDLFLTTAQGEVRLTRLANQATLSNIASVIGSTEFQSHASYLYADFRFAKPVVQFNDAKK